MIAWGSMDKSFETLVALAKEALREGHTRGRFIRDQSSKKDSKAFLQKLSNAFSEAMSQMQRKDDVEL